MRHGRAPALLHLLAISVLAGSLVVTSVAATGASAKSGSAKKTVRIGVLLGSTENTYDQGQLVGIKAAAAKFGGEVVKVFGANFDASKQATQVEDAITAQKYDVFIIEPAAGNVIVPQVKKAVEAGIKVVCLLSPCGADSESRARQIPGYVTSVGMSFTESGIWIAKGIVAACGKTSPCKVAYEPGNLAFPPEAVRTKGLTTYLEKYPQITIVAQQEGKYLANSGRAAMQNMLQAHPDINVAASSGDQMTIGMEQAVKSAGLTGKVLLVGNGASTPGVAAVGAGRWFATVANLPYTEGYLGTKFAIMAANGTPLPKIPPFIDVSKYSPVGTLLITKANASKFKAQWAG